jgi:ABC-type taurine transport system substrate-binding protein
MIVVNLPDDEFSKPVLHTIDWASFDSGNFNKNSILPWLN